MKARLYTKLCYNLVISFFSLYLKITMSAGLSRGSTTAGQKGAISLKTSNESRHHLEETNKNSKASCKINYYIYIYKFSLFY